MYLFPQDKTNKLEPKSVLEKKTKAYFTEMVNFCFRMEPNQNNLLNKKEIKISIKTIISEKLYL